MYKNRAIAYYLYMGLRNQTSKLIDGLLTGIEIAGVTGLALVAPNSLVALNKYVSKSIKARDKDREAARLARYLKQQKLINISSADDGSYVVTLTEKGLVRSRRATFESLEVKTNKWDKKWRVVMFDIPEKHKTGRDYISRHLRNLGFKQLQRSVFIYPYAVDEFIALIGEILPEISPYIAYMTVEDIDQHNKLVEKFKNILP